MPASDCEPSIIIALQKAGWLVTDQPLVLAGADGLQVDMRLQQADGRALMVAPVQCFDEPARALDGLQWAIGRYALVSMALHMRGIDTSVFMPLPTTVYGRHCTTPMFERVRQRLTLKVVVIDMVQATVERWLV